MLKLVFTLALAILGLAFAKPTSHKFSCEEGKHKTCRTITSCEEAMFYLEQCGITRLDADNDGIPCECDACIGMNPGAERCKMYRK